MPRPVGMATRDRGKFWNLSLLAELSFWAGLVLALPPAVSLQTCWTPARAGGQDQPRVWPHTAHLYTRIQAPTVILQAHTNKHTRICCKLPVFARTTKCNRSVKAPTSLLLLFILYFKSSFFCVVFDSFLLIAFPPTIYFLFCRFASFGSSCLSEETKPIYSQLFIDASLLFNFSHFLIFLVSFSIFSVLYWWNMTQVSNNDVGVCTDDNCTLKKKKLGFRLLERLNFRDFFSFFKICVMSVRATFQIWSPL